MGKVADNRLNVIHVGVAPSSIIPGGLNRFVDELTLAQAPTAEVRVCLLGEGIADPGRIFACTPQTKGLARWKAFFIQGWRMYRNDVVDIHFAYHGLPFLIGASLKARRRVRYVAHFHGPWASESLASGEASFRATAKYHVERLVYRNAAECIVLSDSFASALVSTYGVSADRVRVIRPGVDTEWFAPADKDSVRARLPIQIPSNAFVVVVARRLVPRMGIEDLIDAVSALCCTLVIVGDGPLRPVIEHKARTAELANDSLTVYCVGRVSDAELRSYYQSATVAVVPTVELEGFGLVALESMACGTVTVVRPQGGLPEAVGGGVAGSVLASDMSIGALTRALLDGESRAAEAGAARAWASRFSWAETALQTFSVYRDS